MNSIQFDRFDKPNNHTVAVFKTTGCFRISLDKATLTQRIKKLKELNINTNVEEKALEDMEEHNR